MTNTIDNVHQRNRPMPEMITRNDIRNTGGWDVANVRAVRGEPFITVSGRMMRVPLDDSELAQAIRGHEQIHVKVSPQDLSPFISDVTSEGAIRAAEEARVNFIASQLGFPMKALVTGSEKFDGKTIAENFAWADAVYALAASVHTGSLNPLISGIRSVHPEWADTLRDIAKEIEKFQKNQIKEIKKYHGGANLTPTAEALKYYGSTDIHPASNCIKGMNYTIELAMLLESIAAMPAPDTDEDSSAQQDTDSSADSEELPDPNVQSDETKELADKKSKIDRNKIQQKAKEVLCDNIANRGIGEWRALTIKKVALTITVQGAVGKKRVASNIGRNPRRMHRLLIDPERRVFDKTVKGSGGVVLIDCSGSMRLSKDEVKEIMTAAPGCTVLGHAVGAAGTPNLFIIADNGKMCATLPEMPKGNGNDLPAIEYAVKLRQTPKAPVIWITDGLVYRPSSGAGNYDQIECAKYARRHNVHMTFTPAQAVEHLKGLQNGKAHKPQLIPRWKELLSI